MKYCTFCGKELKDDDLFCSSCGNKVEEKIVSEKITVKKHTTLSTIALVFLLISCFSFLISIFISMFTDPLGFHINLSLTGVSVKGILGSVAMFCFSAIVTYIYNKEVLNGKVSTAIKILCFFVSIVSGILILCDKDH